MMHLTDIEIQEYVLQRELCSEQIVAHMQGCDVCRGLAEEYVVLFTGIREQPEEVFDFDVRELVLAELEKRSVLPQLEQDLQRGAERLIHFGWVAVVLGVGVLLYLFRASIVELFTGIPAMLLYFIIIPAGILVFFLLADMYKSYQRKITQLGRY